MNILWFTWKDLKHPLAGGAEVINEEIAKRFAAEGHNVKLVVGGFEGGAKHERVSGYEITRLGNRFTVYWQTYRYYKKHLQGWADLVIDEVNTVPYFAKFYTREPTVLFVHQLCREIWFYQLPPWLGWVGYIAEPIYLRMLKNQKVITVSNSSRQDLVRHGFKLKDIHIISEGIGTKPLDSLQQVAKYQRPTMLSLGALRPMKRTLHQVKAFEQAKEKIPDLQLKIAGDASDSYGQSVLRYIKQSPYKDDIEYLGRVSNQQRQELMKKSHVFTVTSVKEGWGLVVSEAASQGTPAVVYDADGLRDSVLDKKTGLVTKPNEQALADGIVQLLSDSSLYNAARKEAWEFSKTITFSQSYADIKNALEVS